jgi:hypothetical protein
MPANAMAKTSHTHPGNCRIILLLLAWKKRYHMTQPFCNFLPTISTAIRYKLHWLSKQNLRIGESPYKDDKDAKFKLPVKKLCPALLKPNQF